MSTPPLASGPEGPDALRPLLDTVLHALAEGTVARGGPLPAGGPEHVAERLRTALGDPLPQHGSPDALHTLVRALAEGAADPADPLCAAHLHCPPLAVATAADLAASALNPSLDSWDQAPAASELEALLTRALADLVYGNPDDTSRTSGTEGTKGTEIAEGTQGAQGARGAQGDALVTTGGTESNQLALLLAREKHHGIQLVCGANAHHSLHRATWLLGLPEPVVLPAPAGTLDPAALDSALSDLRGPLLVAATAGTTDAGLIDPLPDIADLCATHGARLHIDAAYGGGLLFSDRHRTKLDGLAHADTVTLDLHKLGWQPVAAGLLAVRDPTDLTPSPTGPTTSTPTTTPKQATPTSSAAPCAPPAAPTSSRSPSPSRPSDATASAISSTRSAPTPTNSPTSPPHTPASSSTTTPSSAPSSSGPEAPPTTPSPPYAAPSSTKAAPSSAAPPSTAAAGSKPPSSTPTPGPATWPRS